MAVEKADIGFEEKRKEMNYLVKRCFVAYNRYQNSKKSFMYLEERCYGAHGLLKYYCDQQVSEYKYSHMDMNLLKDARK